MKKLLNWLKNNKLTAFFLIVIGFLLFKGGFNKLALRKSYLPTKMAYDYDDGEGLPQTGGGEEIAALPAPALESRGVMPPVPISDQAPQSEVKDRLVVEESNVSLLVEDVRQKVDQIINYAEEKGGYMVSSSLKQPEEAPFATVVLRIPSYELRSALDHLRSLAVRVTSENLKGWDVTDEYVDLEARVGTLEKTKTKFEEILNKAVSVDEILRVQRELINLQQQIDNLKGRQDYLEKTAQNAKLTVYLSSDEWALPYAPSKPFRAKVIFKTAVRSLVLALRGLAKLAIWVGVYSIIWLPVLIVYLVIKKRKK